MIKEGVLRIAHHWKIMMKDKKFLSSLLAGLLVFFAAHVISMVIISYNETEVYVPVKDMILDWLPTYDLTLLYIWGSLVLTFSILIYGVVVRPEIAPFGFKTFGILLIVRALFISLTHFGTPVGAFFTDGVVIDMGIFNKFFFFKNDLFFSNHTAVPFLGFLLFKDTKIFKWVMLVGSLTMGTTVLLMHVHYSIDVFAAFFIAYGIYALSNKIFNDLNVRFKKRIKMYGWKTMKKRMETFGARMRIRRDIRNRVKQLLILFK